MPALPQRSSQHGFTLIEICVALLIVGILAGVLTLSIVRRPLMERQHRQAQRLYQLLDFAAEQAQLQTRQIGLLIGPHAYRFLYLDDSGKWVPYASGSLRLRKLPHPFELRLHVNQHAITASRLPIRPASSSTAADSASSSNDSTTSDSGQLTPQILLLSSGETTAFQLDVTAPETRLTYRISSNAIGDVKLKQINLK